MSIRSVRASRESLELILAKKSDIFTQIQAFILGTLSRYIFVPRTSTETDAQYSERIKAQNEVLAEFIKPEAMHTWLQIFIHSSVDLEFNYDSLENLGDKILAAVVMEYVRDRFYIEFGRLMTDLEFTSGTRNLLSNERFEDMSKRFKLTDMLISFELPDVKIRADMFEALIGAIKQIGDNVGLARGTPEFSDFGNRLVRNLIIQLYRELDFKTNYNEYFSADVKSRVQQVFRRLKWSSKEGSKGPNVVSGTMSEAGKSYDTIVIRIFLTNEAREWFLKYRKDTTKGPTTEIGQGSDRIKSQAEMKAYTAANEWLEKEGINEAFIINHQNEIRLGDIVTSFQVRKDVNTPRVIEMINAFKARVTSYTSYEFKPTQQLDYRYIYIIATQTNNKKVYLARYTVPGYPRVDDNMMNLNAISVFLTGEPFK